MNEDPYDVMDLKALKCFWAMAKNLSFTKAGIELGISEAAVSQRVKSLEHRLNIKLYEARGGHVKLTPMGERTMEMAVSLFDTVETFEDTISREEGAYEITLCTHDSVMCYLLPQIVEDLSQAYPLIHLRLLRRSLDECVQLVRSNESDIAIIPRQDLPREVQFHIVARYPGFLVLPKRHPLVRRARNDFNSLLNDKTIRHYPLIMDETQVESEHIKNVLGRFDLPINVGLEVGNFETLKHYVQRGMGIALVSGLCLTKSDRERFEVVEVPVDLGGETIYGVVLRKDKNMTSPLTTLLQLLGIDQ